MICVSLVERTLEDALRVLRGIELAEIRLDRMDIDETGVRRLFSGDSDLIATCRPGSRNPEERRRLLEAAIEAGARYVDIEMEADPAYRRDLAASARSRGCLVIVSHHNHDHTPGPEVLNRLVDEGFAAGADIVKIACFVRSAGDNARLLALLDGGRPVIPVGLGPEGLITRIAAPLLGSPFTYASLTAGKETAEGQPEVERLLKIFQAIRDV